MDDKKIISILTDVVERLDRIEKKITSQPDVYELSKPSIVKNIQRKNPIDKIDPNKLPNLINLGTVRDQCLYLLDYVSKDDKGSGGLATNEMKNILADKFGLTKITIFSISMAMKKVTGKYVTRKKIGEKTEKFEYQILTKGKEYVASLIK